MNFSGKDGLAMPTPFFADLVREMCQEGGTGPLTPSGAVPGHRRFAGAVPADTRFHYHVAGVAHPCQRDTGMGRLGLAAPWCGQEGVSSVDLGGDRMRNKKN